MDKVRIFFEDLTYHSNYEFLEFGKNDDELKNIANKRGVELPSKDLAIFKGRYALVDQRNKNGCTLPKKEVRKALKTLVGKAVDKDHLRKATIGYWLDASLEDDEIISYGAFWKSNFPEDFDNIQKKMKEGSVKISFEAWGDRQITAEKEYNLTNIEFAGGALLFDTQPAFDEAEVMEFAKVVEPSQEIVFGTEPKTESKVEKVSSEEDEEMAFIQTVEGQDLAEMECTKCDWCGSKSELKNNMCPVCGAPVVETTDEETEDSKKLTYKQRTNLSDSDFAVVVKKDGKTIRMFPCHDKAHVRNALARLPQAAETLKKLGISIESVKAKILKKAKELKMTELIKRHEKGGTVMDELLKKYNKASIEEVVASLETEIESVKASIASKDTELATLKTEKDGLVASLEEAKKAVEVAQTEVKTIKETLDKKLADEKASLIKARREELGEEFAKILSDEDILDAVKFELAQTKKELAVIKASKGSEKGGLEAGSKKLEGQADHTFVKQDRIQKNAFSE